MRRTCDGRRFTGRTRGAAARRRTGVRNGAVCGSPRARIAAAWCVVACASIATGCATGAPAVSPSRSGDAATAAAGAAHGPHDSLGDFLDSHLSADAWREDVRDGYLGTSAVLFPAGLALGAGAIAPWDHTIERHVPGASQALGNVTLLTLIAGAASAGFLAPREGRDPSGERWTIAETFAVNSAATFALNVTVRRARPGSDRHSSFPSGHASTAFAAATLIDRNSGHAWGIPAYALAAVTAVSRVESGRHYPSDVLAGAALGVLSASIVDALHFGGNDDTRGISRRHEHSRPQFGLDADSNGRPLLTLTLLF